MNSLRALGCSFLRGARAAGNTHASAASSQVLLRRWLSDDGGAAEGTDAAQTLVERNLTQLAEVQEKMLKREKMAGPFGLAGFRLGEEPVAKTPGTKQNLEVPVTNFQREDKGRVVLNGEVFDHPIRVDIVHRVVRWQRAKARQGTHSTKDVSEVSGTGKKPYKQKGTGRARHGSLRGPQFRGGGVAHGPKPRDHSYKLQKKVRRLGLKMALSARMAEGRLYVFDDLKPPSAKTRDMAEFVGSLGDARRILMVDGELQVNDELERAAANLRSVDVLPYQGVNVLSILQHDTLIMHAEAIKKIEEWLQTPVNRRGDAGRILGTKNHLITGGKKIWKPRLPVLHPDVRRALKAAQLDQTASEGSAKASAA